MSIKQGHITIIGWGFICCFGFLLHFKVEYFFKDARPERETAVVPICNTDTWKA